MSARLGMADQGDSWTRASDAPVLEDVLAEVRAMRAVAIEQTALLKAILEVQLRIEDEIIRGLLA